MSRNTNKELSANSVSYSKGFSDGCDVQRIKDSKRIAALENGLGRLKRLEGESYYYCPACGSWAGLEPYPKHKADCWLVALIEGK